MNDDTFIIQYSYVNYFNEWQLFDIDIIIINNHRLSARRCPMPSSQCLSIRCFSEPRDTVSVDLFHTNLQCHLSILYAVCLFFDIDKKPSKQLLAPPDIEFAQN